jgi:predicted Zn-dependent protease with MMP-like domain
MIRLTRKAFDRIVEDAIASLPEDYARWIDEVPIIVEDRPGKADADAVCDPGVDDTPLGLYVGRGIDEGQLSGDLPPRVMIYRVPLMEACASREELEEEIRKTLLHELGHHAGMDEDQLEELGYGPFEPDDDEIEWEVDDDHEKS